ncbi:hypothetical protein [Candidatus Formimonas warabiya]|uniref:Uncharacterized protein n=1 Tax=Formimonas warabiya TaxID=1761012 RepID=A0A3G1KNX1_FORW1|nr:hypothetical protein [Candidatus Formimonas warabiya]ATW24162.1 hypothetical protein DCMF_04630 [Candidatus Formimonas warabiya]
MTDLELVRANVVDEVEPYTFNDPMITALLSRYNNDVNQVSSHIWLIRAGQAAKRNFKFTVDGTTIDKTMTAKECREQAVFFKELAMLTPGDGLAEIEWTNAFDPPEGY